MDLLDFKNGFPAYLDDWKHQQQQVMQSIEDQYKGLGAFVISGCQVSGNTLGNGLAYIEGKIRVVPETTGLTFPAYIIPKVTQHTERFFSTDNVNKTTRINYHVDVVGVKPGSGEYIVVDTTGVGRRLSLHVDSNLLSARLNSLEDMIKPVNLDDISTATRLFGSAITDLNQINKPGTYLLHTNAPGFANTPASGFTVIQNIGGSGGNMFQYLRVRHSPTIYHRELDYNSAWRAWYKIAGILA